MEKHFTKKWMQALIALLCLAPAGFGQGFVNPCPVPPSVTGPVIALSVDSADHNFSPVAVDTFNNAIPAYCYNSPGAVAAPNGGTTMTYLGPTMIWNKNQQLTINVTNNLDVQTTTHWHGANLKAEFDGGPQEVINANGGTFNPSWIVRDSVTTHWYHSHLLDQTTEQVARGLAGFIIVQDPANDPFYNDVPHDYGYNDFPLVLQEKGFVIDTFAAGGPEVTAIDYGQVEAGHHPSNQFYTPVNGALQPVLHVPASVTRFRFLNGSLRKSFQFGMYQGRINPFVSPNQYTGANVVPMVQIGTDGGYIENSFTPDSVLFGPGERVELVVDFTNISPTDTVFLINLQRGIPSSIITTTGSGGGNQVPTQGFAFMAFVVDPSLVPPDPISMSSIPASFISNDIDTSNVNMHRTKVLTNGNPGGFWTINGDTMNMMMVNDTILVNTQEIWTIWNTTTKAHPFHIHKTEFKVLDIFNTQSQDTLFNVFDANPSMPQLMGDKDVVMVLPNWKLRFVANFDSFPNSSVTVDSAFMYHCHILTHEDHSMMNQFIVVDLPTWNSFFLGNNGHNHGSPFTLYPNPTEGLLTLKGKSEETGLVRMIDPLGRVVWQQTVQPFHHSTTLDLSGTESGLYFIEWKSATMQWAGRVVLR